MQSTKPSRLPTKLLQQSYVDSEEQQKQAPPNAFDYLDLRVIVFVSDGQTILQKALGVHDAMLWDKKAGYWKVPAAVVHADISALMMDVRPPITLQSTVKDIAVAYWSSLFEHPDDEHPIIGVWKMEVKRGQTNYLQVFVVVQISNLNLIKEDEHEDFVWNELARIELEQDFAAEQVNHGQVLNHIIVHLGEDNGNG